MTWTKNSVSPASAELDSEHTEPTSSLNQVTPRFFGLAPGILTGELCTGTLNSEFCTLHFNAPSFSAVPAGIAAEAVCTSAIRDISAISGGCSSRLEQLCPSIFRDFPPFSSIHKNLAENFMENGSDFCTQHFD